MMTGYYACLLEFNAASGHHSSQISLLYWCSVRCSLVFRDKGNDQISFIPSDFQLTAEGPHSSINGFEVGGLAAVTACLKVTPCSGLLVGIPHSPACIVATAPKLIECQNTRDFVRFFLATISVIAGRRLNFLPFYAREKSANLFSAGFWIEFPQLLSCWPLPRLLAWNQAQLLTARLDRLFGSRIQNLT